MPISEILNAVFLTFLATEYLISTNSNLDVRPESVTRTLLKPRNLGGALLVATINVLERYVGLANWISLLFHSFLHAPKIILAAVFYLIALYQDCARISRDKSIHSFLRKVGRAFCYVLPVYPFLAVLISCGFFIFVTILELLKIDPLILNWPIYYGTLYGPFSFVYYKVKRDVMEERTTLPSSGDGRRLGKT